MKTMPSRSQNRRISPPPAPRISHRPPAFRPRGRSPDTRRRMDGPSGGRGMSPPRSRERREFAPSQRPHPPDFAMPRRSRSPLREPKRRSFSPKRKMSPKREREAERDRPPRAGLSRKRSRSKTPPGIGGPVRPYSGSLSPLPGCSYQVAPVPYSDGRTPPRSLSDRFRATNYDGDQQGPVFQGPDGLEFDISELKRITIDIRRNLPVGNGPAMNPENVVRRPDVMAEGGYAAQPLALRGRYLEENRSSSGSRRKGSSWEREASSHYNDKSEGARDERSKPTDEHHRVVAILDHPPPRQSSGVPRFESPGRYPGPSAGPSHSRDPYYSERDYRSKEYERSHGPPDFESRNKVRDDRFDRGDDLRHDLESRRRDDNRYGEQSYEKGREYRGDSDRGSSDLRRRINEKRTDRSPGRHHMMDRREPMERDSSRDRRMMQPSPPGERRRGPPPMEEFHPGPEPHHHKMREEGRRMPPMVHHGPGEPGRRDEGPERLYPEHPPEFGGHQRQERFHPPNKPWDGEPKGRPYFEHENREDMRVPNQRGRGMMGPRGMPRGRGTMRGRPFRGAGPTRFMRGVGRRGGYSPRKSSPGPDSRDNGYRGNKFDPMFRR